MFTHYEHQFDDFEYVPEPPEPEEPGTWTRYSIIEHDNGVIVHAATNDNLDKGYPDETAHWTNDFNTLPEAIAYTGVTYDGPGHKTLVDLNGHPLYDKGIDKHRLMVKINRIINHYDQRIRKAQAENDANAILLAIKAKMEEIAIEIEMEKESK